jgi:ATP-dependent helicase HrpA
MPNSHEQLESYLQHCLLKDRYPFQRRLNQLQRRARDGKPIDQSLQKLAGEMEISVVKRARRRDQLPLPQYPEELPISQRRDEIAQAIRAHQVVIVCGETGSGKTTQLPKICLELGFGASGMIGHTQPRRIAARSVAARIAQELDSEPGSLVGYKVRFSDRVGPNALIKLMTDGMLLAETQSDRFLNQYEVIIVDEAHERSLNIDFLLGYLHRLLPKRPDLKLIITSATIDPERFSRHFGNAPIIEVSGRSYPVDILYRPLVSVDEDERDRDLQQAIVDAVDELSRIDRGDILIFLSGEREIRETTETLRKHKLDHTEILPLYARLSAAEQNRVFQTGPQRRIVLATNVAETSLTVPGIRYVIDPGEARISRYSHRSKVQRLPIEPISQASAAQRAGRCGRVAPGVCIRLYSEEDFAARPEFTEPEILRTNLAAVILQMCHLNLGEVVDFPFIEAPDRRLVSDGFKLLFELHAVDADHRISELGRRLAKLPIDPRLGRMLLAARDEGCLHEALVITSALAIQDPRERPLEKQQAADEKHRRFRDDKSDFQALLNLWDYYHEQARHLSKNKLRKLCRDEFLSFVRMREWHELHQQLHALVTEMGMRPNQQPAEYNALHRALLSGLLGHVGMRQEEQIWLGARGRKFYIFPGSGLFKKGPKWLMAAELVETTRLYARTIARIDPAWIEKLAPHLVKKSYSEPHWEKRAGQVAAKERVMLYGLPIVVGRRVNYGPIDSYTAREIFIRDALVGQDIFSKAEFLQHNRALIAEVEQLEAKGRRRDLLADEETLYRFYDERIPRDIYSTPKFERWRKRAERDDPRLLFFERELLFARSVPQDSATLYPDTLDIDGMQLPLDYQFEPAAADDGVTLTVPLAALNQIDPRRLEWLVPGLLPERMAAMLKSLPKSLRKHFVPVPNYVGVLLETLQPGNVSLAEAMAERLAQITGVTLTPQDWHPESIAEYLKMRLRVVDADGAELAVGRDLEAIQKRLSDAAEETFSALPTPEFEREQVRDWNFGDLPGQIEFVRNGVTLKGYPALLEEDGGLALRLLDSPQKAQDALRCGLRRLISLKLRDKMKYLKRNLPHLQTMSLHYIGIGTQEQLREDLLTAIIDRAFFADEPLPRNRETFEQCMERGRAQLMDVANELCDRVAQVLATHHNVRKRLNGKLPLSWAEAVSDIREQLDNLVYPGFVSRTPYQWLQHLPRYLRAIELRVEKLSYSPDKDRQRLSDIARLWDNCRQRWEKNNERGLYDPELEKFRWMLEELRVSQFAQELKTALPVSVKRLEAQWQKIA